MNKAYSRIIWQNQPSTATALGATNLNKMDNAINTIDDRVVAMDTAKAEQSTVNNLVKSITYNESNGVLTITKQNNTTTTIDTKLEKLAVNFTYNPTTQKLVITLDDGTTQEVDLSSLISQYEFVNTSTVAFVIEDGKVKANVVNGSITADKLQPNYLADITVQAQTATAQANKSKRYAVGGVETGDITDNAKYYKEQAELFKNQAKTYRDEAQDISNVGIASENNLGLVKGNGSVTVQSDGSMWLDAYKNKSSQTGTFITCPTADDALAHITKIVGETVQTVTVEGKNILPNKAVTTTINGVTFTVNADKTVTVNGTATANTEFDIFKNETKPLFDISSTYFLSGCPSGGSQTTYFLRVSDITTSSHTDIGTGKLCTNIACKRVLISVSSGVTVNNLIFKPQIELGSTATTYETFIPNSPSVEYPSTLKYAKDFALMSSGKNMFNINDTFIKASDITNVVVNDDSISVTSNNTSGYSNIEFKYDIDLFKGKTVKLSYNTLSSSVAGNSYMIQVRYIVGTTPSYMSFTTQGATVTVPYDATGLTVKIMTNNLATPSNVACTVTATGIQMEFVNKTEYEPYKGIDKKSISFPFMGLPNGTKNSKEIINGVTNNVLRASEIIYDGSSDEAWLLQSINSNNIANFQIALPHKTVSGSLRTALCNMLTQDNTGIATANREGFLLGSGDTLWIRLNSSRVSTVADFRTWLATNNIILQYERATPVYTPIDPIYLNSYKGTTHLLTSSDPQVTMSADFKSQLASNFMNVPYLGDESEVVSTIPTDSDLLGGQPKSYYEGLVNTVDGKVTTNASNIATINSSIARNALTYTLESGVTIDVYTTIQIIGKVVYFSIKLNIATAIVAYGKVLTITNLPSTFLTNQLLASSTGRFFCSGSSLHTDPALPVGTYYVSGTALLL